MVNIDPIGINLTSGQQQNLTGNNTLSVPSGDLNLAGSDPSTGNGGNVLVRGGTAGASSIEKSSLS